MGTEGASLHRASLPSSWADGWHSALGRRVFTQGSAFEQRAWPQRVFAPLGPYGQQFWAFLHSLSFLMSMDWPACILALLAAVVLRGRMAIGGMSLQAAGPSVFAISFFCQGGAQPQDSPKLCTLLLSLLVCRVGGLIGHMPAGPAWPQSIFALSAPTCAAGSWLAQRALPRRAQLITWVRGCALCAYLLQRGSGTVSTFYYPRIVQPRGRFHSFH